MSHYPGGPVSLLLGNGDSDREKIACIYWLIMRHTLYQQSLDDRTVYAQTLLPTTQLINVVLLVS